MALPENPERYEKVPYELYDTIGKKLRALLNDKILYLKGFESVSGNDVLLRLAEKGDYSVTQISYDVGEPDEEQRYWQTFNVGIIDLSAFPAIKYKDDFRKYNHKFNISDIVGFVDEEGVNQTGYVQEIYRGKDNPDAYAYMLSGKLGLFREEDLVKPLH